MVNYTDTVHFRGMSGVGRGMGGGGLKERCGGGVQSFQPVFCRGRGERGGGERGGEGEEREKREREREEGEIDYRYY